MRDLYQIKFDWLLRMRWGAVLGQLAVIFGVTFLAHVNMPWVPMLAVVSITFISNIWARLFARHYSGTTLYRIQQSLLVLDVVLLTGLLYLTGGARNPFHYLYIIHIALAALTLSMRSALWITLFSACFLGILYVQYVPLQVRDPWLENVLMPLGAWTAFVVASAFIAFFLSQLSHALRKQEQSLSQLRERQLHKERLASLATLAAGAAHELANPLSTIAVAIAELSNSSRRPQAEFSPQDKEDIQLIRDEIALCQDILASMSIRSGHVPGEKHVEFDPEKIMREAADEVLNESSYIWKGHTSHPIRLHGSARAFYQALKYVLDNAKQASTDRSDPIEIRITDDKSHCIFEIIDSGVGMSEETLQRVGEPFFTTKPAGKGMGLGIFFVKSVMDALNATFELHSKAGRGTRAVIKLSRA